MKYKLIPSVLWDKPIGTTLNEIEEIVELTENTIQFSTCCSKEQVGHKISHTNVIFDKFFYLDHQEGVGRLFDKHSIDPIKLANCKIITIYKINHNWPTKTFIIQRFLNNSIVKYTLERIVDGSGFKYVGYSIYQLIPID
jgi:hypothetical protein